jgi:hypothetical protein
VRRVRLRYRGGVEQERGGELVVRRHQRVGVVDDADATVA